MTIKVHFPATRATHFVKANIPNDLVILWDKTHISCAKNKWHNSAVPKVGLVPRRTCHNASTIGVKFSGCDPAHKPTNTDVKSQGEDRTPIKESKVTDSRSVADIGGRRWYHVSRSARSRQIVIYEALIALHDTSCCRCYCRCYCRCCCLSCSKNTMHQSDFPFTLPKIASYLLLVLSSTNSIWNMIHVRLLQYLTYPPLHFSE